MPSMAVEDYLKTIYSLSAGREAANTSAIADRLGIAAGSVTGMLKRLAEQGLVEHVPYYGARLTAPGEREAVRLIRRHRVLELFMVQVLGYTWDRVQPWVSGRPCGSSGGTVYWSCSWCRCWVTRGIAC